MYLTRLSLYSPDIEREDIVEKVFRLFNLLLETNTAERIEIVRRYKIEPLCLHWAVCTDGHQEQINLPAARLWCKLNRESFKVDDELLKDCWAFLSKYVG